VAAEAGHPNLRSIPLTPCFLWIYAQVFEAHENLNGCRVLANSPTTPKRPQKQEHKFGGCSPSIRQICLLFFWAVSAPTVTLQASALHQVRNINRHPKTKRTGCPRDRTSVSKGRYFGFGTLGGARGSVGTNAPLPLCARCAPREHPEIL